MKLSILIPVYNEVDTLLPVLEKIEAVDLGGIRKEIIIIDDCSSDGSREVIRNLDQSYVKIFQETNKGKGAALKQGIEAATGEYVIFQDADLEYDPEDYKTLLEPILEGKSGIVYGSRFENRKFVLFGKGRTIYITHWIGNKMLAMVMNSLYGMRLTDAEPCYKLFKSDILKSVTVDSDGFEYDIELMCKLARKGHAFVQLPISYEPRTFEEGKKIGWKDGFVALKVMLKCRLCKIETCADAPFKKEVDYSPLND